MVFDALEHWVYSLAQTQPVNQIDQIQIRELTVEAVDLHVNVADLLGCNFQVDRGLKLYKFKVWKNLIKDTMQLSDEIWVNLSKNYTSVKATRILKMNDNFSKKFYIV